MMDYAAIYEEYDFSKMESSFAGLFPEWNLSFRELVLDIMQGDGGSAILEQGKDIISLLGVSIPTAGNILKVFCETGILADMTPEKSRNKIYCFTRYVDILNKGTELYPENR